MGQESRAISGVVTMTKSDIVDNVYSEIGLSKKEAAELVELVFGSMKEVLQKGESVKISGFGNFNVKSKDARRGRNPQTGEQIIISARHVLTFRPSQILKALVNGEEVDSSMRDED